jgi:hypothetical protein
VWVWCIANGTAIADSFDDQIATLVSRAPLSNPRHQHCTAATPKAAFVSFRLK